MAIDTQCQHLTPALNTYAVRVRHTTTHPIATQFSGHGCMDHLTTERFDSQATRFIDVLGFFEMLSMGVCTTRHWRTTVCLV